MVSGLSAAATIHTAAIAAVQPNTARSELAGVVTVVIVSKRLMRRMLILSVMDGTVGGIVRSLPAFLV